MTKEELRNLSNTLYQYWHSLPEGTPEWYAVAAELQKVDAKLNNHEVSVA